MEGSKLKIGHVHVWDRKNKGNVAIACAVQDWLGKLSVPCEVEDFPVEILQKLNPVNLARLNACDLVLVGGGGIYYQQFFPLDVDHLSRIVPPLVIFGVGHGREIGEPEMSAADKQGVYELNSHAALTSVRDYETRQFLIDLGVDPERIELVGDPAIFLPPLPTERIDFDRGRIRIGINLNCSGWKGFDRYRDLIIESYNQVGNYFQEKFGAQIFYLKHHPSEENAFRHLDVRDLEMVDLDPRQQKFVYFQMDFILGMMLNTAVLAFGADTPFLNLGYDIRNVSFGDFIGFPELVLRADELEDNLLLTRAMEVFGQREDYERKFSLRKNDIHESQSAFLAQLDGLLQTLT